MKRLGFFLLVVAVSLGVSGCSKSDPDPTGTWRVFYDIGCNGSQSSMVWFVQSGGAFSDDDHDSGTWDVNRKKVFSLRYYRGDLFVGILDGDEMSGSFTGHDAGCWSAQRTSGS